VDISGILMNIGGCLYIYIFMCLCVYNFYWNIFVFGIFKNIV